MHDAIRQRRVVARSASCRAVTIVESDSLPLQVHPEVTAIHLSPEPDEVIRPERRTAVREDWSRELERQLGPFGWTEEEKPRVLVVADPSDKELVALHPLIKALRRRLPRGVRWTGLFLRLAGARLKARQGQLVLNLAQVVGKNRLHQVVFLDPDVAAGVQAMAWLFLEMWLDEPLGVSGQWLSAHLMAVTEDESARDILSVATRLPRQGLAGPPDAENQARALAAQLPVPPEPESEHRILVAAGTEFRERWFPEWELKASMQVAPSNGYLVLQRTYGHWADLLGMERPTADLEAIDADQEPEPPPPEPESQDYRTAVRALFDLELPDLPADQLRAWFVAALMERLEAEQLQEPLALAQYAVEHQVLEEQPERALQLMLVDALGQVDPEERVLLQRLAVAMARVIGTPADDFTAAGGPLGRRLLRGTRLPALPATAD